MIVKTKDADADAPPAVPDKDVVVDSPPSYSALARNRTVAHPHASSSSSGFTANHATNHLTFKTRNEPISGLFQIDPGMDVHNPHLEKLRSRKRKDKKGKAPWNSTDDDVPNATFETRQGDIALSLAAVAPPPSALSDQTPRRVMVDVSARQGNIDIVVFQIDAGRHLNLKVETRQGDVHVFVPRSFAGPIHTRSKKGKVTVLPHLVREAQVISSSEREAMVVVGHVTVPTAADWLGDYLTVLSRSGEVVVGYHGEDELPEHAGFWKRVGQWFSGGEKEKQ